MTYLHVRSISCSKLVRLFVACGQTARVSPRSSPLGTFPRRGETSPAQATKSHSCEYCYNTPDCLMGNSVALLLFIRLLCRSLFLRQCKIAKYLLFSSMNRVVFLSKYQKAAPCPACPQDLRTLVQVTHKAVYIISQQSTRLTQKTCFIAI